MALGLSGEQDGGTEALWEGGCNGRPGGGAVPVCSPYEPGSQTGIRGGVVLGALHAHGDVVEGAHAECRGAFAGDARGARQPTAGIGGWRRGTRLARVTQGEGTRVFITGARGFIGGALARRLRAQGAEVRGVDVTAE